MYPIICAILCASTAQILTDPAALRHASLNRDLGLTKDVLSRSGELGKSGKMALLAYKASLEAELRGDLALAWRAELEVYRLSQAEFAMTSSATIDRELQRNFRFIPSQIAAAARITVDVPHPERLRAAAAATNLEPDNPRCGNSLIEIMEERYQYRQIVDYCSGRILLGHEYFRCLRAKMNVHHQLELNHLSVETEFGKQIDVDGFELLYELYTPNLREQVHVELALEDIQKVLQLNPLRYVLECSDIILLAYVVSWLPKDDVLAMFDLCMQRIVESGGSIISPNALQIIAELKMRVESLPPNDPSFVEVREYLGQGKELHEWARVEGELIDAPLSTVLMEENEFEFFAADPAAGLSQPDVKVTKYGSITDDITDAASTENSGHKTNASPTRNLIESAGDKEHLLYLPVAFFAFFCVFLMCRKIVKLRAKSSQSSDH